MHVRTGRLPEETVWRYEMTTRAFVQYVGVVGYVTLTDKMEMLPNAAVATSIGTALLDFAATTTGLSTVSAHNKGRDATTRCFSRCTS
jgi:hypothetical protein